ncbi:hypothetical protein, partial [Limnohabitans sp.]|uniref:hypothetical protein n=1 Tax=Limnohabitans sp. TaxID=1907725 RepID=UPI0037BFF0A5
MITLQRINEQGSQTLQLADAATLQLRSGESLVLAQEGVTFARDGLNLIISVPASGQLPAQSITVQGFFNAAVVAQVLLQEPGEPVRIVNPSSLDVPPWRPSEANAPAPLPENQQSLN